jgi:hypothetical protein
MPVHDLICHNDHLVAGVYVDTQTVDRLPPCSICGAGMLVSWAHGQAPATDVKGSTLYSEITGEEYTSSREHERKMMARGYEPAGDRIGGARTLGDSTPRDLPMPEVGTVQRAWQQAQERVNRDNAKPVPVGSSKETT